APSTGGDRDGGPGTQEPARPRVSQLERLPRKARLPLPAGDGRADLPPPIARQGEVMRRLALGVAALLVLLSASAAWAGNGEPVSLTVPAPAVVASNVGFPVRVTVASDPGALSGSFRVRVKAASECGATFDSPPGAVLLDKPLGSSGKVAGTAKTHSFGSF